MSLSRLTTVFIAAVLLLSACSGSATTIGEVASADASTNSEESVSQAPAEDPPAPAQQAPAPVAGEPSGSLTLSTGQTFDLAPRSCETQSTDPNSLLNENFFDLFADTTDGQYSFSLNSASFAESTEPEQVIGGLTGERDENGVNPAIDYIVSGPLQGDPDVVIAVNGAEVSGVVLLDGRFAPNKAFGDTVSATFVFSCG